MSFVFSELASLPRVVAREVICEQKQNVLHVLEGQGDKFLDDDSHSLEIVSERSTDPQNLCQPAESSPRMANPVLLNDTQKRIKVWVYGTLIDK